MKSLSLIFSLFVFIMTSATAGTNPKLVELKLIQLSDGTNVYHYECSTQETNDRASRWSGLALAGSFQPELACNNVPSELYRIHELKILAASYKPLDLVTVCEDGEKFWAEQVTRNDLSSGKICQSSKVQPLTNACYKKTLDPNVFKALSNELWKWKCEDHVVELVTTATKSLRNISLLPWFAGFENLVNFGIFDKNITSISNLDELRNFPGLKNFGVDSAKLEENALSLIESLHSLENLQFVNIQFPRLPDLRTLHELNALTIRNSAIQKVPAVSETAPLKQLDLGNNAFTEIDPSSLPQTLETLNLSQNPLKDLPDLGHLQNLKSLSLTKLSLNSLAPLANVTSINEIFTTGLSYKECPTKDVAPQLGVFCRLEAFQKRDYFRCTKDLSETLCKDEKNRDGYYYSCRQYNGLRECRGIYYPNVSCQNTTHCPNQGLFCVERLVEVNGETLKCAGKTGFYR